MKPDLESLYSQLELRPDCSLEEFQRAYRRRISELHPDRNQGAQPSAESQSQLRHLLWMHATVNRFHRRYGRMPGARRRDTRAPDPRSRTSSPGSFSETDGDLPPGQSTWILMVLLIALMVLGAFWNWLAAGPKVSTQVYADSRPLFSYRPLPQGGVLDVWIRDCDGNASASHD